MTDRFRWLEFEGSPAPEEGRQAREDPGDRSLTLLERATRLYLEGEFERALREYARTVEEDRACFEAWAGQVRCQLAMGEPEQARTWALKAAELFPESPLVQSAAALVLAWFDAPDDALGTSDLAMRLAGPEVPPVLWLERGLCLLKKAGSRDTARDCFARLPADPDWRQRVGEAWLQAGVPELARSEFTAALEGRPDRPYLWLLQARASLALQQPDQARFALGRALALRPGYPEALEERRRLRGRPPAWAATLLGWLGVQD